MVSHYQTRKHRPGWRLGIFLLSLVLVSSHEAVPPNHQDTPDVSTLKIEARESEASIILGKDLVLGPPLSTRASIVADFSNSDDPASTKINSLVPSTIVNRISSGEHAKNVLQKPSVSKNETSRGSYIVDSRYRGNKGPKTVWKRDSYLEALRHSRNSDDPREGIVQTDLKTKTNRREYVQGPPYRPEMEYGPPESSYASKNPRITYGGPSDSYPQSFKPSSSMGHNDRYNGPQNSYGPPQTPYGPSQDPSLYPQTSSYGPPGNSYPPPQQGYGPSIHTSVPTPIYGAPYALPDVSHISLLPSFDLGLPFALKLNAFTIAKIILKLVIFKMIVKFIAAICLLLFIPKLEIIKKKVSNKDDDDDEERSLSSPYTSLETLNNLEGVVKSSVEKFEAQNSTRSNSTEKCTTVTCRMSEVLTFHETWYDYLNLFNSYVEEERQLTGPKEQ
ncbi:uncharacterized protein [Anoplolepis gracilipes]|uniref:uncharacterized protein n=1 Tax=Anoplolepis gracilipes TaxID=354296 RepID=UPI003BA2841E